ncbi:DNA alkylation repair protein [Paenibacillus terrigena]|uniref:DNA alkylation repair protein n=1 Tax=Paenibacillus terrigena TaxID=369333 RepID=UPI0028D0EF1F|nr:DNA alkylation repair protein [Paenibacillus terrigena]
MPAKDGNPYQERIGARKLADIPSEVVNLLQQGKLQSVNLTEWLAVDHLTLLQHIMTEFGMEQEAHAMMQRLHEAKETKIMKTIPSIATEWLQLFDQMPQHDSSRIFRTLAAHPSDSVRCWAAYIIGLDHRLSLQEKLASIRPFAADAHFGVREIAWMAVRESIAKELEQSISLLADWVCDPDANIRRFAIESTRPVGVWAKHIQELKVNPRIALPLLDRVKADSVKYVQDSAGNWLNDASKTNPDWVMQICDQWLKVSDTKETKRIVMKAKRSLDKKK